MKNIIDVIFDKRGGTLVIYHTLIIAYLYDEIELEDYCFSVKVVLQGIFS